MGVSAFVKSLARWTPLVFLSPRRFVDWSTDWASFDFEGWSAGYRWTEDRWNGWLDVARTPRETVTAGRGDCEDYALVAASWSLRQGRVPVGLGFCFVTLVPRHVVAYDDERVYSSGDVTTETLDEYVERSPYRWVIRRRLA